MMVRRNNPHIREDDVMLVRSLYRTKERLGIGEPKKQRVQWERQQATTLEGTTTRLGLFQLHKVDFVHFETVKDSKGTLKAGFPDYFLLGADWFAFLEIKARNKETNRAGRLDDRQREFHARLTDAGCEVWTALLPDDLEKVNLWLREKTGIVVEL